ncbi:hypothetical protein MRB53_040265 [Persea americana]|nr:hypothetical protein MRB53_040265 [Persea americana]
MLQIHNSILKHNLKNLEDMHYFVLHRQMLGKDNQRSKSEKRVAFGRLDATRVEFVDHDWLLKFCSCAATSLSTYIAMYWTAIATICFSARPLLNSKQLGYWETNR